MSAFFCSYSWSYWRNFSCYFFCLVNLVTFLFVFLLKKNHRNFCFSIFSSKRKKEKKQWIFFSHFFSWYQAASCVLTIFFSLFVRSFVCWFVVTPGKQITTTKEKLKREKTETETKKLRHVSNDTVQCSSVLVLEVVFDGLGQVQFGDFALLNAFFINRLTYNAATQIHQGQRFSWNKKK